MKFQACRLRKGMVIDVKDYKVSIIVPVYNAEQYLKKCVDSLVNQTYGNLEILLIDDGSRDGSGAMCDALAKQDSRIKVIHKENGGLISAWKKGVEESTGEYLSFVDSDDWIDRNMIEEMADCLTGHPREIVASDYVIERSDGSREFVFQRLSPGTYDRQRIESEVIPNLLGRESRYVTISRCMKLIARKLIEENQHYSDPRIAFSEDSTIMLPALIDCERLVIMDHKAYYHYLYVASSMIHKYDSNMYPNIKLLRQVALQVVTDKFTGEERRQREKQVDMECIFWLLLLLKNEARGNPQGYRRNILEICRLPEIRSLVKNTPVTVEQTSNRLLYLVLRHPGEITVRLLRAAMIWYYRKKG